MFLSPYFLCFFNSWKEGLLAFEIYSSMIVDLKTKATGECNEEVRAKLYDKYLLQKIEKDIKVLKSVEDLESSENIADIISKWFELYNNSVLIDEDDPMKKEIFSTFNLTAHVLTPKYRENLLNSSEKMRVRFLMSKLLNDHNEYKMFDEYVENKGEFHQDELDGKNTSEFWTLMKGCCKKLAELALIVTSIPCFIHHENDKQTGHQNTCDSQFNQKLEFVKSYLN